MKRSNIHCLFFGTLMTVATVLTFQPSAQAIVINDAAGAATAQALGAPMTNVVELFLGGFLCTGGLIDSTHVITAKHCTSGISVGLMTTVFHDASNATTSVGVTAKAEAPAGLVPNSKDGSDVAILTLASAAPAPITPLEFLHKNPVGTNITTVGFGKNGLGGAGHGGSRDGLRWAATNVTDSFGAALDSNGNPKANTANIWNTDFDDGTAANNILSTVGSSATPLTNEGTTAGGDSGGPLLVGGRIVGVLTGGTTGNSVYGDVSWWTGTLQWRNWILTNAPGARFVPEPSTIMLMTVGLIGMGVRWYRRRTRK